MIKKITKIFLSVVFTVTLTGGILYATTGNSILTFSDVAGKGSIVTSTWVNAVNNRLNTLNTEIVTLKANEITGCVRSTGVQTCKFSFSFNECLAYKCIQRQVTTMCCN